MKYTLALFVILSSVGLPGFAKDLKCKIQSADVTLNLMGVEQKAQGAVAGDLIVKNFDKEQGSHDIIIKIRGKSPKTIPLASQEKEDGQVVNMSTGAELAVLDTSESVKASLVILKDKSFTLSTLISQMDMSATDEVIKGVCSL